MSVSRSLSVSVSNWPIEPPTKTVLTPIALACAASRGTTETLSAPSGANGV